MPWVKHWVGSESRRFFSLGLARGKEAYQPKAGQEKPGLRRYHGQSPWGATKTVPSRDLMILSQSFYSRPTVQVAKDLLGQILVHETSLGVASGRIVEVEAYLPKNDPGCHAARGKTPRNEVMFGPAGFSYVYFCYGNHFMFNFVTEREGVPGAVLVRALEPVKGAELMAKRRMKFEPEDLGLTNGPGKLVQALGIHRGHNQLSVFKKPIYVTAAKREESIGVTTRIGITEGSELPLRFYLKGNPYLSVKAGMDRPSPGRKKLIKKGDTKPLSLKGSP